MCDGCDEREGQWDRGAVGSPFAARGLARRRVTCGVQPCVECEYMYYGSDEGGRQEEKGGVASPFAARDRTTTCNAWFAVLRLTCSICIMDGMWEEGEGRAGAVGSPCAGSYPQGDHL